MAMLMPCHVFRQTLFDAGEGGRSVMGWTWCDKFNS